MEITDFMKDIAIFGAGGFGREVACLINRINQEKPIWNLIGFFDDNKTIGESISHFGKILGNKDTLNSYPHELAIVVAIGNPIVVKSVVDGINNDKIYFPNLIHPNFVVADPESFSIGRGNIIQRACVATCNVSIGDFNTFNGSICLGHDVNVGSYNAFMPAVRISGNVHIGNQNFFGVASIVLQQLKIGENVKLGAGSVLMTKPKNNSLYMGNPAKIFKF